MVDPAQPQAGLDLATLAAGAGANLIEWRVEQLIGRVEEVQHLVRESPRPTIVTCRSGREGGRSNDNDRTRLEFLHEIVHGASPKYLDIEFSTVEADPGSVERLFDAIDRARQDRPNNPIGVILSIHDFEGRPANLLRRVQKIADHPRCSIVKVAWRARSVRDNLQAFEILRERTRPTIALCMGEFGLMSRVLAPKFGGFLTYASIARHEITAPGQPTIDELRNRYQFDSIRKDTKVFGVIGWPIEHSLSPDLHNAAFNKHDYPGVYVPLPVPPEYEHYKATMLEFFDCDFLDFTGASITLPHKEHALRLAETMNDDEGGSSNGAQIRIHRNAQSTGAANTVFKNTSRLMQVSNTDVDALVESILKLLDGTHESLAGLDVAVIGTGGAARAAIVGLLEHNARVHVVSRDIERARALASEFTRQCDHSQAHTYVSSRTANTLAHTQLDVLINATPVGMTGGLDPAGIPVDIDVAALAKANPRLLVYDMVYQPPETPLITAAKRAGCRVQNGAMMLARQAAAQFQIWTGTETDPNWWEQTLAECLASTDTRDGR